MYIFLMETFGDWLLAEIENKGWKQAELARRAHIQDATLSRIITGSRQVGPDVGQSIAQALEVPPEKVFRKAGLLPSRSPREEDIDEALWILGRLTARMRLTVLAMLRGLPRVTAGAEAGVVEERVAYEVPREDDVQVTRLMAEFAKLADEDKEIAIAQVAQLKRRGTQGGT